VFVACTSVDRLVAFAAAGHARVAHVASSHQYGSSFGSCAGSSHTPLPTAFQSTILNTGLLLRPYFVAIGAASSATTGSALGWADRIRAIESPRLITASRPPHDDVLKVEASAVSGSTR